MLAQENSKGYLAYHFNNVGSTMAVTDQSGAVTAKYNYSPYGELIEGEYDDNIQFLYNGQYGVATDGNGLYYMRARYYNVDIKRFINQDVLVGTLERISSLNRYSYVEGNPVSYLDPFGLAIEKIQKVVGVISAFVSCLQLFSFIAPTVVKVADILLNIITIVLDIIQCVRYGGDEERINKLKEDVFMALYDKLIPKVDIVIDGIEYIKGADKVTSFLRRMVKDITVQLEDGLAAIINALKGVWVDLCQ